MNWIESKIKKYVTKKRIEASNTYIEGLEGQEKLAYDMVRKLSTLKHVDIIFCPGSENIYLKNNKGDTELFLIGGNVTIYTPNVTLDITLNHNVNIELRCYIKRVQENKFSTYAKKLLHLSEKLETSLIKNFDDKCC